MRLLRSQAHEVAPWPGEGRLGGGELPDTGKGLCAGPKACPGSVFPFCDLQGMGHPVPQLLFTFHPFALPTPHRHCYSTTPGTPWVSLAVGALIPGGQAREVACPQRSVPDGAPCLVAAAYPGSQEGMADCRLMGNPTGVGVSSSD